TPWTQPWMLATCKLAPALAAGNTVGWKPSEFASVSALTFGELFEKAGFPPGVVNIVTGYGNEVGEPLVTHPDVAKIAFTGGDRTGEHIYQLAARGIKHVTLELGGKSANIVFDDADLEQAVNGVVSGIFTGVRPEMRIANEEVFGPVLSIIPFDDEDEAVRIANGTVYGLAAGVWTTSIRRAITMSERLEAGTVWVNTYRATSYMSPFGG